MCGPEFQKTEALKIVDGGLRSHLAFQARRNSGGRVLKEKELKALLRYEKVTGEFYWRPAAQKTFGKRLNFEKPVGFKNCGSKKYKQVKIQGRWYRIHTLVWFFETGKWPKKIIDHVNGNQWDNRFENLREVDVRGNSSNQGIHRAGKLPGCYFEKPKRGPRRWKSQLYLSGHTYNLGRFSSEEEAHTMYLLVLEGLRNV